MYNHSIALHKHLNTFTMKDQNKRTNVRNSHLRIYKDKTKNIISTLFVDHMFKILRVQQDGTFF